MKRKQNYGRERSTGIALIFFLFCLLLIGGGLLVKLALIYVSAKFDGTHQVILEVQNNPTSASFIALSPDTQSASVLKVTGRAQDFGKYLEIPVDIRVLADPSLQLSDLGQYILFHHHSSDTANMIDRIRIFLYTAQLKPTDVTNQQISLNENDMYDNTIQQLFTDHTLYLENKTIAIVNATGISGLGNTAAKLVSDLGGNVISVTTGDIAPESSLVYHKEESYTTHRLATIFHVKEQNTSTTMLYDIVITIGQNGAWQFK